MNYIYNYKKILLFFLILISLFSISNTYKINTDKNKIIIIDLSEHSGHRFYNIYNKLEKKYSEKFSLIIKSIGNNPIMLRLLVEEKSYNFFKTNKHELCKVSLFEKDLHYMHSLNNNRIICINDKKKSKNINFLKFSGPVDSSIIYREKFEYRFPENIKLIYDL